MANNVTSALQAMDEAAEAGAEMVCFPELQFSPFFPQFPGRDVSHYAMALNHPLIESVRAKCAEKNLIATPNFFLEKDGKTYDASLVIDGHGDILGISTMVHVAQLPNFYEQDYYTPSETGFHVYSTPVGKIGIVICFDRHYPESIRTCVMAGADIIVIPTANTKAEAMEMFEWELRVPAMQHGVFIAMCNRVGLEGAMDFSGESIIVGPDGDVIVKADDEEQILYADLDLTRVRISREQRPYARFLRPEFYYSGNTV